MSREGKGGKEGNKERTLYQPNFIHVKGEGRSKDSNIL